MRFKKKNIAHKAKPSRKQLRKEKRIQKKVKKNEYYTKRGKQTVPGQFVRNPNRADNKNQTGKQPNQKIQKSESVTLPNERKTHMNLEHDRNKEKKQQHKLEKEMTDQRNKQLQLANDMEDRNIKTLEKHLKLNKRKSKGIPKSFSEDGLDYLLEICDPDEVKSAVTAEQQFADFNDDFVEDLELMSGKKHGGKLEKISKELRFSDDEELTSDEEVMNSFSESDSDGKEDAQSGTSDKSYTDEDLLSDEISVSDHSDEDTARSKVKSKSSHKRVEVKESKKDSTNKTKLIIKSNGESEPNRKGIKRIQTTKRKILETPNQNETDSEVDQDIDFDDSDHSGDEIDDSEEEDENKLKKGATKVNPDGTWEDIYGRLRANDGSLISNSSQKYMPPAKRAKMEQENSSDKKFLEKLNRLKKQLKGLTNRLAESNMHNIANQIEQLYMNNARNDMNETLTGLILDSSVSNVSTPERLLMEHVLLMVILHANVGTEVGAHFLQTVITKFDDNLQLECRVEDKTLDNITTVLTQLYNFKVFGSKLMYEIVHKLGENFSEKNIDCILNVLRNVGFNLRKDDPLAFRDLIVELQKKAATISENAINGSRVKFLLDILLAIKNNNMSKIPNYDNSYSEHLKKIMKGFIRKGNYVTQLNITLEDLLKAEEKGKWWVVGSAWTGSISENQEKLEKPKAQTFSQKLLKLAKKQRMNTDTRRNIFCIIMSAEDYLDAFEKLLHLGLTNNQDREIIHVILHCCLQENPYNPYYAFVAQKFCDYNRKYQLTIKYSIWDKLKALGEQSANQLSNLAKLLTHLFLEKGLPISTLKIVQFSELDKLTLRFMRQILLGILLHEDMEACSQVFEKVAQSDKLKMFRESLRLFIHHFLLKNINSESVDEKQMALLETRAKSIETLLIMKDRAKF